jgi:DUF3024 family protein
VGAVPDLDLAKIARYCRDTTPPEFRDQMRVEMGVRGKAVTLYECRPPWEGGITSEWSRLPVGQLRYDPTTTHWTLYWADRNARWHPYDLLEPGTAEEMLREIEEDPTCIFWG